jgi:hypothetical protein
MILRSVTCTVLKWAVFSTFRLYVHLPSSISKEIGVMNSNGMKADVTIDGQRGRGGDLCAGQGYCQVLLKSYYPKYIIVRSQCILI